MSQGHILNNAVALYRAGRFQDAMEAFEQVPSTSHQNFKRVTRSATSMNLDHLIDTLRDFKKSVSLVPDSCQGPRSRAKLSASLKIIDSITGMLPKSDEKRRTELQILREQAVSSMKPRSIFDRLPDEVQTHILSFLISGRKSGILTLMLVCRTWNEMLYNTPRLWRRFDVHYWTTQKTADAWLTRARGIVTSLLIEDIWRLRRKQNIFRRAAKNFWSRVEELIICISGVFKYLPEEAIRSLRVRSLVVERNLSADKDMWEGIHRLDTSSIRILVIDIDQGYVELEALPFSNLTTLELTGYFWSEPFFELLRRNPMLETLILIHKSNNFNHSFVEADELVRLPLLRRLELDGRGPFNAILRSVKVPNLSVLRLEKVNDLDSELCVDALHSQNLTFLHHFYLRGWTVSFPALLALLQSWTSLTILKLSYCSFEDGDLDSVIKALSEPASEAREGSPPSMLCAKLQYLNLSSSYRELDADTLLAFVKARNDKTSEPTNNKALPESPPLRPESLQNRPLPILYLNLDETYSIPPETIRVLRDLVPRVSCEEEPARLYKRNEWQWWWRH